ncbi:MAG: hypothetical protein KBT48_03830 [Firmicutes bacterium]|nr:hypothetical protein [Bacillota bacterium]
MKLLKKLTKWCAILSAICASLVALSMVVYYFNLDMKLTSKLEKPLDWWYENRVKRNRGL